MSAIAGIYFRDRRAVDPTDLDRMEAILTHRGSDGTGIWNDGPIGLAHRMLWTTPESLDEKLPLMNKSGDLVLTADARIDNRDELIAALGLTDRPSGGISDSQLILAAYEKWSEGCPERLLGDFAFALWDGRKQALFCARDHFGVRPFYYFLSERVFVFASEIKALLCLSEVPRQLNEVGVADYLEMMFEDKVITFYQDICRLPPAHSMTVSRKGKQLRSYWSLDPSRELQLSSDTEYAEAYCQIFTEAVRCRLRSAFPIGSLLSGGLDSSSIVCVARELLAPDRDFRLHTFSAIINGAPECDERPFINAVLAQGGVDPHYVHGDRLSPLADLDRVLWHQDEPFYGPNLFLHWALWGVAQQQGVRVLLDGIVGDSVVSHGHVYLAELASTWRWIALAKELKGVAGLYHHSLWKLLPLYLWYQGLKPMVSKPVKQVWRALRGQDEPVWHPNPVINPDLAWRIGLADRVQTLAGYRFKRAWSEREEHYQNLTSGVIPSVMEVIDRGRAAFSLEARFPFLDRRLVEFCLALPPAQKFHRGWMRMIVRRALVNVLPEKVRWRDSKGDYAPNLERQMLAFEQERLEDVILHKPQSIEAHVNVAALQKRYQRYVRQGGREDIRPIWLAVLLAVWLRRTGLAPQASVTKGNEI